jgi:hypothetical protein
MSTGFALRMVPPRARSGEIAEAMREVHYVLGFVFHLPDEAYINVRARARRDSARRPRPCASCETVFTPPRDDGYCTVICRMRAYRLRKAKKPKGERHQS